MHGKVIYFAYGSNMLNKRMENRCTVLQKLGIGYLSDWRFEYDGGEKEDWENKPVGNIVRSPGDIVWGVLYLIESDSLKKLDKFEHAPRDYSHTKVIITDERGEKIQAIAYSRLPKNQGKPSDRYLKTVIQGAIENKLPKSYIDKYLLI